jgi:hypothetical protein
LTRKFSLCYVAKEEVKIVQGYEKRKLENAKTHASAASRQLALALQAGQLTQPAVEEVAGCIELLGATVSLIDELEKEGGYEAAAPSG